MESQPQNPEFRISPENFRPYNCHEQTLVFNLCRFSLLKNICRFSLLKNNPFSRLFKY